MKRKSTGQEAVEFILITILVFFGALFVILIFGNKISSFFTSDSSVAQQSKLPAGVISSTSLPKYNDNFNEKLAPDAYSKYNATTNNDGSVSFRVGDQEVTVPKEAVQMHNTVLQTTGSSGATNELIGEIAAMIEKHASEYSPNPVPVELSFGTGAREKATANYTGTAQANITNIKVGNDVVMIQVDQTCTGSSCKSTNIGKYRLEGTINPDNSITADVSFVKDSTSLDYTSKGTFSGTASTDSNGSMVFNGNYANNVDWEFIFNTQKVSI